MNPIGGLAGFKKICGPPFYKPDKDKGIKCYVNSDVACRWDQANDNIIEISCHYVHRLSSIMVKYVTNRNWFKYYRSGNILYWSRRYTK